jgi:hypothetical protein
MKVGCVRVWGLVLFYAVTGVAGGGFATAKLLAAIRADLVAAGATDCFGRPHSSASGSLRLPAQQPCEAGLRRR